MRILFFWICMGLSVVSRAQPSSGEVEKCLREYYRQLSLQDGGGEYRIEEINLLHVKENTEKGSWVIEAEVSGEYANFSLPETREWAPFKRSVFFIFTKQKGKPWQCSPKPD